MGAIKTKKKIKKKTKKRKAVIRINKNNNKNVLFVPDLQLPYAHDDAIPFLKAVHKKYNCKLVINVGDTVDAYSWSAWGKDPDADSATQEIAGVKRDFKKLAKAFPKMRCVIGNHDRRIRLRLNDAGFGEKMLPLKKVFADVLSFPKGWTLENSIILKTPKRDILVIHGDEKGANGTPSAILGKVKMSVVTGHTHAKAFIYYESTPWALIFAACVGCLIDDKKFPFGYNKKDIKRPILSCSVLVNGDPHLIPMELDKKGRWTGRV